MTKSNHVYKEDKPQVKKIPRICIVCLSLSGIHPAQYWADLKQTIGVS